MGFCFQIFMAFSEYLSFNMRPILNSSTHSTSKIRKIEANKAQVWTSWWPPWHTLKVSKFQNEFMKSSFLPKYEPNILRISALRCSTVQGRNSYNIWFIFWEKRWLHKLFWNLLTFTWLTHSAFRRHWLYYLESNTTSYFPKLK